MTYENVKQMLVMARGTIVSILDAALKDCTLSQKEREVMYFRVVDWNSLETTGKKFGLTRERIRQIEAKAEEKLRLRELPGGGLPQ